MITIPQTIGHADGTETTGILEVPDDFFNSRSSQVEILKAQLSATDYKVIKCAECSLAGLPAPYDILEINTERQLIRDQINALEG